MINCYTNADILIGVAELDAFGLDPVQRTIRSIIDVDDDLVLKTRIFANTANAQLQKFEIVPGWNNDGKHSEYFPSERFCSWLLPSVLPMLS